MLKILKSTMTFSNNFINYFCLAYGAYGFTIESVHKFHWYYDFTNVWLWFVTDIYLCTCKVR